MTSGDAWPLRIVLAPGVLWLALVGVLATAAVRQDQARAPADRRTAHGVTSQECARCHEAQFASWRRSFHRTMTQVADRQSVVAPFAGESFDYLGFRAVMTMSDQGVPHMRIEARPDRAVDSNTDPMVDRAVDPAMDRAVDRGMGKVVIDADVTHTVGSHRYQQYLAARAGSGEFFRLPVAWHIGEQRWIHMNGAFLEPEALPGDAEAYMRHHNRWNDNCLFCHNTSARPGLNADGEFATHVGEYGIACEACHGQASLHIQRYANPLARLWRGGLDHRGGDDTIAHPADLSPQRESAICGRCHGQRIGHDMAAILANGDGFVPGTDLSQISRPIFRESSLTGTPPQPFRDRFWRDGTPRLSAYEYQGLLLSACYNRGEPGGLGCNHCHDMHGDEPDMQLRTGRQAQHACASCHPNYDRVSPTTNAAIHGGHTSQVTCQDCHMPRITYGLLQGMISHRITNPDPGKWLGHHDQPDACTQCHVDRDRAWAAANLGGLGFPDRGESGPVADVRESWASRVVLDLLGGDPVQRGLAAHALAQPSAHGLGDEQRAALLVALDDGYPALRWMVWRALKQQARTDAVPRLQRALQAYDPLADAADRVAQQWVIEQAAARERGGVGDAVAGARQLRDRLQPWRDDRAIWIGE